MDVGSEQPLQVIKFDYPESPTKHGWELIEGSEQDLLPYQRDPDHGRILRIKAEQDFCMDYQVGVLQQMCKAIGFVVRSESNFAFYAEIRLHNQQKEALPDSKRLYFHTIEGISPEQHPDYPNEYEVHVPVDRLKNGWVQMKIDLPQKVQEVATVEDEEWEFDRLSLLRLKGSRVEIDCARIELYKENPFEPYPAHEEPSPSDTPSPAPFDHQAILTKRNCQRVMPDKPNTPPQFFVCKGKFRHLSPEAAGLLDDLHIRCQLLEPEEEPILNIQELEGAKIGSRAEMEGILKEFCPELLSSLRQPGEPMATSQPLRGAQRPASAIRVSPAIRQLATLIRARREAGDRPYTLLLGSSLSLTPGVRRAVCSSNNWEAFWTAMERLSAAERRALLAGPLDGLNLAPGYRCLAELAQAGYFDIILTANIDDALDDALRTLPASECQVLCHGRTSVQEIAAALSRPAPRVKAVKLRGDINAYKLPLTPEGQFEFPEGLEEAVEQLLSQDTILVGDVSYDTDIQRCIRQGEGALWVVVPEEPRPGSFLYNAKQARPKGEVITGTEAEFVPFFSALARELGIESNQISASKPSIPIAFEFTFDVRELKFRPWLRAFESLIPALPYEIRAEEALYADGYLDYLPDRGHTKNNKTKWLDTFLRAIIDGEATGGYIRLYNLPKDGDPYDHLKVTIDTQSGELKIEITDSTRPERRQALASRIVEEMGKLKGVRRVMPSSQDRKSNVLWGR